MRKLHLYFSFLFLAALLVGAAFMKDSIFFWFASTNPFIQILRGVLLITVAAQLLTSPPRHLALRTFTGLLASFTLIGVGTYLISSHNPAILDVIVFLQTGIALGITALEVRPQTATERLRQTRVGA